MDNKKIADLIFPNLTLKPEDILARYPKRQLKEGQVVTRFAVLLDLCILATFFKRL